MEKTSWYILRDGTKIKPRDFNTAWYAAKVKTGERCGEIERLICEPADKTDRN